MLLGSSDPWILGNNALTFHVLCPKQLHSASKAHVYQIHRLICLSCVPCLLVAIGS